MLSNIEKKELKKDAKSKKRGASFATSKKYDSLVSRSLDDYLRFLKSVQQAFPSMANKPSVKTRSANRL